MLDEMHTLGNALLWSGLLEPAAVLRHPAI